MEVTVTVENFEKEVLQSTLPVLVDFWAPWCGPCKMIAPVLEKFSKANEAKIKICKINVDDAADLATKYTIMSIPALLLFKNGEVIAKKVGAINEAELEKFVAGQL